MDTPAPPPVPAAPAGGQLSAEQKAALKAFKKRIKAMCLDNESGRMSGPFSSGKKSGIVGITPPGQFPRSVWEELADQGRLTRDGDGLYRLAPGA